MSGSSRSDKVLDIAEPQGAGFWLNTGWGVGGKGWLRTRRKEAEAFLKRREGAVVNGVPIPPRADRIRYEEIADDLRVYYDTTGKRDLKEAEVRLA